ncbi:hypothetical protein VTK73DRAFT_5446 [Phialemonium thermophilum]|uniref:Uncharacterized protein n=1 Tax=Phialemonium thermophilum TaxID=223376 RepID=A0ABR3V1R9_9PEZI
MKQEARDAPRGGGGNKVSHLGRIMRVLLVEGPPDDHPPHLRGTRADLVELGVPQDARRRHLLDVAHAAQHLDAVERALGGPLGGVEDGARAV